MTDKTERWQSVLTALLARADHPATPPAEAELARSKALELAGKYSIGMPEAPEPADPLLGTYRSASAAWPTSLIRRELTALPCTAGRSRCRRMWSGAPSTGPSTVLPGIPGS